MSDDNVSEHVSLTAAEYASIEALCTETDDAGVRTVARAVERIVAERIAQAKAETRREAITLVDERTNGAYLLVDAGLIRSSVTGDLTEGALDSVVIARAKWATSTRFDWSKTENIA